MSDSSRSRSHVTIGRWRALPGGLGTALAADGERTAAVDSLGLTVWSGADSVARVDGAGGGSGRPRFVGDAVLWPGGRLDLASGAHDALDGLPEVPAIGGDANVEAGPHGRYVPTTVAWSADGEALVVTAAWTGPPGPPEARALLLDGSGGHRATLWEQSDLAPEAAWVGREHLVVGCRRPEVFDRAGARVTRLDPGVPAARLESDAAEGLLLVVEHSRLTVWSTASWTVRGRRSGPWLDAAIAPGGERIAAVDFAGDLHWLAAEGEMEPRATVKPPDPISGVVLAPDRVVASFGRGEPVRTAPLEDR